MKNLILFGLFVFLLVAIQFAGGKSVDEIIEKYIRTSGGEANAAAIQSMYMEGLIIMMGMTAGIKISKIKDDLNPSGFNMLWLLTGDEGVDTTAVNLLNDPVWVSNLMAENQEVPNIGVHLYNYNTKGSAAVLIGKQTIEDNSCYHVKLITKEQTEIHYWISSTSFLLQQSCVLNKSWKIDTGGNNYFSYDNYRSIEGIMIAQSMRIEKRKGHQNSHCEIVFNKILINQPVESIEAKPTSHS